MCNYFAFWLAKRFPHVSEGKNFIRKYEFASTPLFSLLVLESEIISTFFLLFCRSFKSNYYTIVHVQRSKTKNNITKNRARKFFSLRFCNNTPYKLNIYNVCCTLSPTTYLDLAYPGALATNHSVTQVHIDISCSLVSSLRINYQVQTNILRARLIYL